MSQRNGRERNMGKGDINTKLRNIKSAK